MKEAIITLLSQSYTENLLLLFSVLGVFVTVVVGFIQTQKTIKSSYEVVLKTNMVEQASKLPEAVQGFVRLVAETLALYILFCNYPDNKDLKRKFNESNGKQFEEIEKIPPLLIAYGSEKSIMLFNVFYSYFKEAKEKNGNVPFDEWKTIYYCLPLLVSLVKYDATGEIVNPAVMYEYLMPEFERFIPPITDEVIKKNDEYVKKLKLSKKFKWKTELI